jgi:hypothetical protein
MSYRKIYKNYHGSIPVDNTGRTFDIHHIDGDRNNNNIENLVAMSIEEHYNLHIQQNEYQAAAAIRMRWDKDIKEISKLNSIAAKNRVALGQHPWSGDGSYQREQQNALKLNDDYYQYSERHKTNMSKRNKEYSLVGKHNFQSNAAKEAVSSRNKKNIENGTHPFCDGAGAESSRKRVKDGTHHFLDKEKQLERSKKAKLVNSIRVKRVCVISNDNVVFSSILDATNGTPNTNYSGIQRAYKTEKEYCGYVWVCLGKIGSSTTISSESTDQVIGKSSAS